MPSLIRFASTFFSGDRFVMCAGTDPLDLNRRSCHEWSWLFLSPVLLMSAPRPLGHARVTSQAWLSPHSILNGTRFYYLPRRQQDASDTRLFGKRIELISEGQQNISGGD